MRVLLVSDTHGELDIINYYVKKTNAELVFHAGDFGFYFPESVQRLRKGELRKLIEHNVRFKTSQFNPLPDQISREELEDIGLNVQVHGDFVDYYENRKRFDVPVLAVFGNHEDATIVKQCVKPFSGVGHITILPFCGYWKPDMMDRLFVTGLGGNINIHRIANTSIDMIPTHRGQPYVNYNQLMSVVTNLNLAKTMPSILISHVSPEIEPLITAVALVGNVPFTISGHMHYKKHKIWECTNEEIEQANLRIKELEARYPHRSWIPFDSNQKPRHLVHINLVPASCGYILMNIDVHSDEKGKLNMDWQLLEIKEA